MAGARAAAPLRGESGGRAEAAAQISRQCPAVPRQVPTIPLWLWPPPARRPAPASHEARAPTEPRRGWCSRPIPAQAAPRVAEALLARLIAGRSQRYGYRVAWRGLGDDYATWEPAECVPEELRKAFDQSSRSRRRGRA